MIKTYKELIRLETFEERFEYLKLSGRIGTDTFGFDRYLNQKFYRSPEWKRIRDKIIIRDNGCDLALPDRQIYGKIIIHHINPISIEDIEACSRFLLDTDLMVCVSHETHNAIHYGDSSLLPKDPIERKPNDTCLWRKMT